jgi:hypothetical protein
MNPATDTHDFQPAPQGAHHGDSSGALFSMYLSRAEKFGRYYRIRMGASTTCVPMTHAHVTRFPPLQTGLFSATVAGFIIEGYKSLKPDPGIATVSVPSSHSPSHTQTHRKWIDFGSLMHRLVAL